MTNFQIVSYMISLTQPALVDRFPAPHLGVRSCLFTKLKGVLRQQAEEGEDEYRKRQNHLWYDLDK